MKCNIVQNSRNPEGGRIFKGHVQARKMRLWITGSLQFSEASEREKRTEGGAGGKSLGFLLQP